MSKPIRIIVVVVVALVAYAMVQRWMIKPHQAELALQEIAALQAIKQYEPQTYALIKTDLTKALREGSDQQAMRARIHLYVTLAAKKYIPRASDAALRRYVAVTVSEIEQMSAKDPAAAVSLLFPTSGKPVDIAPLIDEGTQREDLAALDEVIRTGAASGNQPFDDDRAQELLADAMVPLTEKYGEDLKLLAARGAPPADPKIVCAIVIDLYRQILALPEHDSAMVLRKMFSSPSPLARAQKPKLIFAA